MRLDMMGQKTWRRTGLREVTAHTFFVMPFLAHMMYYCVSILVIAYIAILSRRFPIYTQLPRVSDTYIVHKYAQENMSAFSNDRHIAQDLASHRIPRDLGCWRAATTSEIACECPLASFATSRHNKRHCVFVWTGRGSEVFLNLVCLIPNISKTNARSKSVPLPRFPPSKITRNRFVRATAARSRFHVSY
jgi:hypothetical protein